MPHSEFDLQWLLDREALRSLGLRYARAVDRREPELLRSVYWPDAIDEHGAFFTGSAHEFVDVCMKVVAGFELTRHCILNADYAISGDRAEGELYLEAYHRTSAPGPMELVVGGRYLDRYERREGEWRIVHRLCVIDWTASGPLATDFATRIAEIGPAGRSGAGDPSRDFFQILGSTPQPSASSGVSLK